MGVNTEAVTFEDLAKGAVGVAREGIATSVGLSLLIIQHAQVQRREVMRQSAKVLHLLGDTIEDRLDPGRR